MDQIFVGIDVSKLTLDICVMHGNELVYAQIENSFKAIKNWLKTQPTEGVVLAMENTGRYCWNLYEALNEVSIEVYVLSPLQLKKSLGIVRGKDDKQDSYRIAEYIVRNRDKETPWVPESEEVVMLKMLITERRKLVKQKASLLKDMGEVDLIKNKSFKNAFKKRIQKRLNRNLKDIHEVEGQIKHITNEHDSLKTKSEVLKSIPGVGEVLTWTLIAKFNGMTQKIDPRKMACYAGVAPFKYQSGTSIRSRAGVSKMADKQLKTNLHLSAMTAVRTDPELKKYYERKVAEGKNKMSVLNAVRNKLIHRICAVSNNNRPYKINLAKS